MTRVELKHSCPKCGRACDSLSIPEAGNVPRPEPGDWSVCLRCGAPFLFEQIEPEVRVRIATEADFAELTTEERSHIQRTTNAVHRLRPS